MSSESLKISQECLGLLKKFEGLRLQAYLDSEGNPTIGWGHTGSDVTHEDVKAGKKITQKEAERLLALDVLKAELIVNHHVGGHLTQGQFDALVDFVFNCGEGRFLTSTMFREITQGNLADVPHQLRRFIHGNHGDVVPGLVTRREAEVRMWLGTL